MLRDAFHWETISGQRKWSHAMVDFNSINLGPGKQPAAPGLITVWSVITLITNRNNLERRVASRWHFEQQFFFSSTIPGKLKMKSRNGNSYTHIVLYRHGEIEIEWSISDNLCFECATILFLLFISPANPEIYTCLFKHVQNYAIALIY